MSTISNDSQSNLMDHSAIPGRVPQYNRQLKPMKHSVPTKRFAAWMLLPAAIALGISGYLSYASLTSSDIAGCSGGQVFDCGHVLSTKWSKWLGVPVSLLASITYSLMVIGVVTILAINPQSIARRVSWAMVSTLALSAGLAAIWFTSIQFFLMDRLCQYCLIAHACGLILAGAIIWKHPFSWKHTAGFSSIAASGLAVLIATQVNSEEPLHHRIEHFDPIAAPDSEIAPPDDDSIFSSPGSDEVDDSFFGAPIDAASYQQPTPTQLAANLSNTFSLSSMMMVSYSPQQETSSQQGEAKKNDNEQQQEEPERRLVAISGGSVKLDARQWPLVGCPTAKHIFVEMFDYACPHCRKTHEAVKGAFETLGEDVALLLLPVPMNAGCNDAVRSTGAKFRESCKLSNLTVAVWRVAPDKFGEFHDWMFEGRNVPSYADAKVFADSLAGQEALDTELGKKTASQYVAKNVELYKRGGKGIIPKLMFPRTSIVGEFTSTQGLVDIIQREAK